MSNSKFIKYSLIVGLIIILSLIPLVGTGCAGTGTSGTIANALAATMVPDVNLDVYIYVNEGSPVSIPGNLINEPVNINVDSLAIWGIVNNNTYSIGGALVFTSAADAGNIYSQIPQQTNVWTKLSDRTIYLVQGSGGPAESLKTAISNNHFKYYNDNQALAELALMPFGDATRPAAIGIIKPSQAAVNLLKQYTNANTASTIESIFTWGKPQVIVVGLYSSQPINIADTVQRLNNNTIWDADLGMAASINSAFPGFVVDPIAGRILDNSGYTKVTAGNLTEYQASLDAGNGKTIPVLINLSGNHVFLTASGNESYAQTLMTGISR